MDSFIGCSICSGIIGTYPGYPRDAFTAAIRNTGKTTDTMDFRDLEYKIICGICDKELRDFPDYDFQYAVSSEKSFNLLKEKHQYLDIKQVDE